MSLNLSGPAFQKMLAAVEVEGRLAAAILRREHFALQRTYRRRLAHNVAAGLVDIDSYLYGLRTAADEWNCRVVTKYFRRYGALLQIKKAA